MLINEYLFCRACHEKVCREKLALFGTEKRKSGSIAYRKLQRERRVGGWEKKAKEGFNLYGGCFTAPGSKN